ncbi:MAG: polysaccharide deacetylase family protein [Chitinivibrionales bacterium]
MNIKDITSFLAAVVLAMGVTVLEPKRWPGGEGKIILTFDDGPSERISGELLDVLSKHKVNAVFCYIGKNVERAPEVVSRTLSEGHKVSIHTYSHRTGLLLDVDKLYNEIKRCSTLIDSITQNRTYQPEFFRPPWGLKSPAVRKAVEEIGLKYAYLTQFVNDAKTEREGSKHILERVKQGIERRNGGAVVFHELRFKHGTDPYEIDKEWLPGAVDEFISWAKKEGYEFTLYR